MKQITIAGNVGKAAEIRRTQNGDAVAGFSVAVSEGRDKPTTWFDCALWGKRGEKLAQYITKGSRVTVCGDFSTRDHDGKTYLQVRVAEIALQGGGTAQQSGNSGGYDAPPSGGIDDDQIPF